MSKKGKKKNRSRWTVEVIIFATAILELVKSLVELVNKLLE